jgi:hypothetical protein
VTPAALRWRRDERASGGDGDGAPDALILSTPAPPAAEATAAAAAAANEPEGSPAVPRQPHVHTASALVAAATPERSAGRAAQSAGTRPAPEADALVVSAESGTPASSTPLSRPTAPRPPRPALQPLRPPQPVAITAAAPAGDPHHLRPLGFSATPTATSAPSSPPLPVPTPPVSVELSPALRSRAVAHHIHVSHLALDGGGGGIGGGSDAQTGEVRLLIAQPASDDATEVRRTPVLCGWRGSCLC